MRISFEIASYLVLLGYFAVLLLGILGISIVAWLVEIYNDWRDW